MSKNIAEIKVNTVIHCHSGVYKNIYLLWKNKNLVKYKREFLNNYIEEYIILIIKFKTAVLTGIV